MLRALPWCKTISTGHMLARCAAGTPAQCVAPAPVACLHAGSCHLACHASCHRSSLPPLPCSAAAVRRPTGCCSDAGSGRWQRARAHQLPRTGCHAGVKMPATNWRHCIPRSSQSDAVCSGMQNCNNSCEVVAFGQLNSAPMQVTALGAPARPDLQGARQ